MKRIYIAGPMTGLPDYNLPAFAEAKRVLDAHGYEGVNPGHRGVIEGYAWKDYVRDGLRLLLNCDGIAMLDGWTRSTGAMLEAEVASALGISVRDLTDWLPK